MYIEMQIGQCLSVLDGTGFLSAIPPYPVGLRNTAAVFHIGRKPCLQRGAIDSRCYFSMTALSGNVSEEGKEMREEARETKVATGTSKQVECIAAKTVKSPKLDAKAKTAKELKRSLRLQPDDGQLWLQLGAMYQDSHHWEKAIPALEKAVMIDPELTEAWLRLGASYMRIEQPQRAIKTLDRAVELNPERAGLWHGVRLAYAATCQKQDAGEAFVKAVNSRSGNPV